MDYISGLAKWLSLAKMPSAMKMARFFSPLCEQVARRSTKSRFEECELEYPFSYPYWGSRATRFKISSLVPSFLQVTVAKRAGTNGKR